MHRKPSMKELQEIVNNFNRSFPVGALVILRKDSGEVETKVTHEAYIMGKHSAVAFFEGVSGCYSVEGRVRAAI